MSQDLPIIDSPLLQEVEFVSKMYGELDRARLRERCRKVATYFRQAGDKLCRKRITQLRQLCLANRIDVGTSHFSGDITPDPPPSTRGSQG